MNILLSLSIGILAAVLSGCGGEQRYLRVDEYPEGAQISGLGSSFNAVLRPTTVRMMFFHPRDVTWSTAKEIVEELKPRGLSSELTEEEDNGLLVLTLTHRDEAAKTMDNPDRIRVKGWREELRLEIVKAAEAQTMVIVTRTVLGVPFEKRCRKYEDPCTKFILYQPEISNGQVERWILTRIREQLPQTVEAKAATMTPPPESTSPEEPASAPPAEPVSVQ